MRTKDLVLFAGFIRLRQNTLQFTAGSFIKTANTIIRAES